MPPLKPQIRDEHGRIYVPLHPTDNCRMIPLFATDVFLLWGETLASAREKYKSGDAEAAFEQHERAKSLLAIATEMDPGLAEAASSALASGKLRRE